MADFNLQNQISGGAMANLPNAVSQVYGSASGSPVNRGMTTNGFFTGNPSIDMFLSMVTQMFNSGRPSMQTLGRPNMSAYELTASQTRAQLFNRWSTSIYAMNPQLGMLGQAGTNQLTQMIMDSTQKGGSMRNEFGVFASDMGRFIAGPGISNGTIQANMQGAANMVKNLEDGMHGSNGLWDFNKSSGFTHEQFAKNLSAFGPLLGGWDHLQNLSRADATQQEKADAVKFAQGTSETVRIAQDLFGKDMPLEQLTSSVQDMFRGQRGVTKSMIDNSLRDTQATATVADMSKEQMVQYQGVAKEILSYGGVSSGHTEIANSALLQATAEVNSRMKESASRGEMYSGPGVTDLAQQHLQGSINVASSPVNARAIAALYALPEGDLKNQVRDLVRKGDTPAVFDLLEKNDKNISPETHTAMSIMDHTIQEKGFSPELRAELGAREGQDVVDGVSGLSTQASLHRALSDGLYGINKDKTTVFGTYLAKHEVSKEEYASVVKDMNATSIQNQDDLKEVAKRHGISQDSAAYQTLLTARGAVLDSRQDLGDAIPQLRDKKEEDELDKAKKIKEDEKKTSKEIFDKRVGSMIDQGLGGFVGAAIQDAMAENYKKGKGGEGSQAASYKDILQKMMDNGVTTYNNKSIRSLLDDNTGDNAKINKGLQDIADFSTANKGDAYKDYQKEIKSAQSDLESRYKKDGKSQKEIDEAKSALSYSMISEHSTKLAQDATEQSDRASIVAKWSPGSDSSTKNDGSTPDQLVARILNALADIKTEIGGKADSKSGLGGVAAPAPNNR